jgi:hypothetical protein
MRERRRKAEVEPGVRRKSREGGGKGEEGGRVGKEEGEREGGRQAEGDGGGGGRRTHPGNVYKEPVVRDVGVVSRRS